MKLAQIRKEHGSGIFGGMLWSFGERITAQFVSMLVSILLARILAPEYYGIISIVTIFITLLNVFVSGGFGSALVQKKNADGIDFDTTFILSLGLSVILYGFLFLAAPYIENFYKMQNLSNVIRVMGLRLIIASVNNIQQAYIRRHMAFKRFFWATLFGTGVSGVVGIFLAIKGFGVWALVFQYLTNVSIDTAVLFIIGGWKPRFEFSLERAKTIWKFGWKVLATELVYTLSADVRTLLIGKVFGSSDLAYFDQGKKYPTFFVNNINSSIQQVMLPALSKKQGELDELLRTLRRSICTAMYLLVPLLVGFGVIADTFVPIVLSEKWIPCIIYIRIFCLVYITRPFEAMCHQALLAIGKSGTVLLCMISIDGTGLILAIYSALILKSVLAIALFSLLTTLISITVFMYCSNKYIGYKFSYQIQDIAPNIILSAIMGFVVYFIGLINLNQVAILIIQVIAGIAIYTVLSLAIKPVGYINITGIFREYILRK